MPELPEVEIVCRNLAEMIKPASEIKSWKFFRADLRFKIPKSQLQKIVGRPLIKIERRAKYILFNFGEYIVISHLGMTGSWRQVRADWAPKKHDHLAFAVSDDAFFVFADPRRFGFIEVIRASQLQKRFRQLGVEPLHKKTDFKQLSIAFQRLKSPIKTALMNQKLLVGVGNIYAAEVLFRTGVNPLKICSALSEKKYKLIFSEIVVILNEAISAGGSSILNYRNTYGDKGKFQQLFFVYGRKGQPCLKCHSLIKSAMQAGRSTFWCPNCQKK